MTFIIDASIAIAWVIPEQQTETSRKVLSLIGATGAFAPSLWRLEVANVLRTMIRRKRCKEEFAVGSLDLLSRLSVSIDQETDAQAWERTWELASEYDLTIYDATYLELAIRRQGILATRDGKLAVAGQRAGLQVMCD